MIQNWRLIPRVAGCVTKRYLTIIPETDRSEIHRQRFTPVKLSVTSLDSNTVGQVHRVVAAPSEHFVTEPSLQWVRANHTDFSTQQDSCPIKQIEGALDSYFPLNDRSSQVGCIWSNVRYPAGDAAGKSSSHSMLGAGRKLLDNCLYTTIHVTYPSRLFSTSAQSRSQGGGRLPLMDFSDPTPQGIQGDQCVSFKLWMENCSRYGLSNCDEQLHALKSGRKTLAQVFAEQQDLIKEVAEKYRRGGMKAKPTTSGMVASTISVESPCPQGIQGDECVRYKYWLENCHRFEFGDCNENIQAVQSGRKTLSQIFEEQDRLIKEIVHQYQQRRHYSTAHRDNERR